MKICIESQDDGTFSVYEDQPEAMAPPTPGQMDPAMGGMPTVTGESAGGEQMAATVEEALEIAREMLSPEGADRGAIAKQVWST